VRPTTVPLPGWGALRAALGTAAADREALSAGWARPGERALWFSRSAWSLAALADAFAEILGVPPVVAVPDYICNAALAPLAQRASLVFYPVSAETLAPDWQGCADLPRFDLFLLVHYFGQPSEAAAAADFCADHRAVLIEDAAHVLRPLPGIGETGMATLYSPHKLLAAPDGAALVVAETGAELLAPLRAAADRLGDTAPPTGNWVWRRAIQKTPPGRLLARFRPGGQPDFASDPAPTPLPITPALSAAGGTLIGRADLDAIALRRAANAIALAEALTPLAEWMPLFQLRNDVPPYRLVMRCRDETVADDLYARFRAARLPVESWPDLPEGVGADSAARLLRGTLLLLPCHQGIEAESAAAAYARAMENRR